MNSNLLFNQIKQQLPDMEGVVIEIKDDRMNFYIDKKCQFYIRPSSGLSYVEDYVPNDKARDISDIVVNTAKYVREYIGEIEKSPVLDADVNPKFKNILELGNIVLAGRISDDNINVQFVVWDKGKESVSNGRYFGNDYVGAKEKFAIEANLINYDKIFTTNQLVQIYRIASDMVTNDYDITADQEDALLEVQSKIRDIVPDVDELIFDEEHGLGQTMM